jgi:hypothetical protein
MGIDAAARVEQSARGTGGVGLERTGGERGDGRARGASGALLLVAAAAQLSLGSAFPLARRRDEGEEAVVVYTAPW